MKAEPESINVLLNLLDVQTIIAGLEHASGNPEAGRQEFDTALQMLHQTKVKSSVETEEWLAPQYRIMASVAMQLGLFQEARDLAKRHVESLQDLVSTYPNDEQWRKQADEAKAFVEQLNLHTLPAKS